jgi:hypothetical protein
MAWRVDPERHVAHIKASLIGRGEPQLDAVGPMQGVSGPVGREKVHFEARPPPR